MSEVVVLTGGSTPERTVALAGAFQVVEALRDGGHQVRVVDTCFGPIETSFEESHLGSAVGKAPPSAEELREFARREQLGRLVEQPLLASAEVVFLLLHGRQGEGGFIQLLLEEANIRFTGSGSNASLLAMDKDVAKRLMRDADIPTAEWCRWPCGEAAIESLGWPIVVKPSQVGSTVGLTVVDSLTGIPQAVDLARRFDDEVLLEVFVPGRELTVGVLGETALAVGEIIPAHDVFDFECKYTPGMAQEVFPAAIDGELAETLRSLALSVHRTLKLRDFSRVDFRLSDDDGAFCLEANTLPGMTKTSLLPQSAEAMGVSFEELCLRMVALALER